MTSELERWFSVSRWAVRYRRTESASSLRYEVVNPMKERVDKKPPFGYWTVENDCACRTSDLAYLDGWEGRA